MASLSHGPRVLICAGCFSDAEVALGLVERIEQQLPVKLAGLLVDEGYTTEFLRPPTQRVITLAGDLIDPPTAQQARALAAGDARAFRRMLSVTAQARSVKWSFKSCSGDLIRSVFDAAEEWDILLLGRRTLHKRAGQIVIVSNVSNGSERAEKIARDLAEAAKTNHVKLVLSQKSAQSRTVDAAFSAEEDESQLLARLSRMNAATVVVALDAGQWQSSDLMRQLLEAARCPVVVLKPELTIGRRDDSAATRKSLEPEKGELADE